MAKYSELELGYARPIAQAILERPDFFSWLLQGKKYENAAVDARFLGELQRSLKKSHHEESLVV